jgi:uncharacterized protein YjbJ (UPF0337 family)
MRCHQDFNPATRMNALAMKGNWNIIKGRLRQRWARLTDDDLQFEEGKEAELIGRIQKRTGATRAVVEHVVEQARDSGASNSSAQRRNLRNH